MIKLSLIHLRHIHLYLINTVAVLWAVFQMLLPRFILLDSITVRAVHLAFALFLVFLTFPFFRNRDISNIKKVFLNLLPAIAGVILALYLVYDWEGLSGRAGLYHNRDIFISIALIILVLEAARRTVGKALSIIALIFSFYVFFGDYMPSIFAIRAVSIQKFVGQIALSTEGIYGIPLDVSANTIFLFVLLGSLLHVAGAGDFFINLAIALLGRFKGGAAKASVFSSGLTGLISGSSIANVVTTGTFTIPLMRRVGYPRKIAAATEVAASTNGQLMPPIMGAAAFIIAEYIGISYMDVVKAAILPAVISYIGLFYIVHLEAHKLKLKPVPKSEIPQLSVILKQHYLYFIPILILLYELIILRHSPKLAAFNAIMVFMVVIFIKEFLTNRDFLLAAQVSIHIIVRGFIEGSKNMLSVAIATAAAGIIVGIVTMGIGSILIQIVEILSGNNFLLLLFITAIASLVLGMGLPTTATYIVMATITVPLITKLSLSINVNPMPAIAAHLFCFYFGILADDTPPVGLAAYTAAAIANSDPIATGIQGFIYDLRTAVIPFMFIFNSELLLYNVHGFFKITVIIITSTLGILCFTNAVQGWFQVKNKWYELPLFLLCSFIFFNPQYFIRLLNKPDSFRYVLYTVGLLIYFSIYLLQQHRHKISVI